METASSNFSRFSLAMRTYCLLASLSRSPMCPGDAVSVPPRAADKHKKEDRRMYAYSEAHLKFPDEAIIQSLSLSTIDIPPSWSSDPRLLAMGEESPMQQTSNFPPAPCISRTPPPPTQLLDAFGPCTRGQLQGQRSRPNNVLTVVSSVASFNGVAKHTISMFFSSTDTDSFLNM
ncbi:hypothetical protein LX36DRAFT_650546 [Colletotrichum falcatum]|nr:hypothetical protein LX36DRAFT_650546 [Colletotrichum falcatum]